MLLQGDSLNRDLQKQFFHGRKFVRFAVFIDLQKAKESFRSAEDFAKSKRKLFQVQSGEWLFVFAEQLGSSFPIKIETGSYWKRLIMKKLLLIVVCLGLIVPTVCLAQDAATYATPIKKTNYEKISVIRVIDGNTLELENGERVRLIGIDCPEIDTEEGKKVREFVKGLVEGNKEVRLEFDVQQRDKNGRLLAYVYALVCIDCQIKKDERFEYELFEDSGEYGGWYIFLNASVVKVGFASPMTIPPNVKHADLFVKLYQEAREQGRGLWKKETKKISPSRYCKRDEDCKAVRDYCNCIDVCVNKFTELENCPKNYKDCRFTYDTLACYCENNKCVEGSRK